MRAVLWSCVIAAFTVAGVASRAGAQRLADLRPAAAQRTAQASPGTAALTLTRPTPTPRAAVAADPPRRVWPWFVLGGAVAGAGAVVALTVVHCDAGCRDDGGWGYVPYYAGAAALGGAVVGGVVGAVVEIVRRHPGGAPIAWMP